MTFLYLVDLPPPIFPIKFLFINSSSKLRTLDLLYPLISARDLVVSLPLLINDRIWVSSSVKSIFLITGSIIVIEFWLILNFALV